MVFVQCNHPQILSVNKAASSNVKGIKHQSSFVLLLRKVCEVLTSLSHAVTVDTPVFLHLVNLLEDQLC